MAEGNSQGPKFYAIVGGLNGFNGVATDWHTQAYALTTRVSNCRHKRFRTVLQATAFVSERTGIPQQQVVVLPTSPQRPLLQQQQQTRAGRAPGQGAEPGFLEQGEEPAAAAVGEEKEEWHPSDDERCLLEIAEQAVRDYPQLYKGVGGLRFFTKELADVDKEAQPELYECLADICFPYEQGDFCC